MSEHASFLASIIAAPDDDGPRLIFADWLEEQGERERAEFIRVQCELAKGNDFGGGRGYAAHREALRRRERELMSGPACWVGIDTTAIWPIEFSRGFVESIQCSWSDWLTHADAIRAATPLRKVRLTTWPEGECDCSAERTVIRLRGRNPVSFRGNWLAIEAIARELNNWFPGITFTLPEIRDAGRDDPQTDVPLRRLQEEVPMIDPPAARAETPAQRARRLEFNARRPRRVR